MEKWTWVRHVTNPVNRGAVLGRFVTASPKFISHERRKIRHSFLIFTISSNQKLFSKSPRQKKTFWNSLLNRLASPNEYKMLIPHTYFVIFWRKSYDVTMTSLGFCAVKLHISRWLCSWTYDWGTLSMIQRRKYATIVNIIIRSTLQCREFCVHSCVLLHEETRAGQALLRFS